MQCRPDAENIEKKVVFGEEKVLDYIRKSELFTAPRSLFPYTFCMGCPMALGRLWLLELFRFRATDNQLSFRCGLSFSTLHIVVQVHLKYCKVILHYEHIRYDERACETYNII